MSETEAADVPEAPATARTATVAPTRRRGDRWRLLARGTGQTLITLGLVLTLFVVYEVYVTNITAHHRQTVVREELKKQWASGHDPLRLPSGAVATIPAGTGIANLYLPRLGRDYAETIVEGTSDTDLTRGPGHYDHTALPGAVGNFAVAGHRVGKGEPFLDLDHLRVGDAVIVETFGFWYVYRVTGSQIVTPDDSAVIDPVPNQPKLRPTQTLMTMTTCHPKFTATHRLIVFSRLDPTLTSPRTSDTMPAAILALYDQIGH